MAISDQVRSQLFQSATSLSPSDNNKMQAIRIPTTRGGSTRGGLVPISPGSGRGLWTPEEHLRFLEALDKFPSGPWKCIAAYVGSKTARQAMTHGQKYRQKIARRRRGLKKIVRDLQFADRDEHQDEEREEEDDTARLSVESNPVGLSDQDFAAFVASLDLAEELQSEFLAAPQCEESPLVVPAAATYEQDMANFSLGADVPPPPASVTSDCGLPLTTPQQDVHHWVVMGRADTSSEEFSTALAEAFKSGYAEAEEYAFARPEQLLGGYCQEQATLESPGTETEAEPALPDLESFELDEFELR